MANQVYEMVKGAEGLEETLRAKHFPFPVIYGPQHPQPHGGATLLLFQRDRMAHEAVTASAAQPVRQTSAPVTRMKKWADRTVGVECRIYARASVAGAMPHDHEELADYLADGVICAVIAWCEANKAGAAKFVECRYLVPDELMTETGEPEKFPGVVYMVRFQLARGVFERTFEKLGKPVGLITGVSNEADVRLKDEDPPAVVGPFPAP